ncbi:hypothetical protein TBLA_0F02750 [Henningerozyma blattae CBS 6284]|uniref:Actin cytoskeleton-regulatory complex protein PAN1 n=1 Tax=Henningerozyma blattae (strain ATCC 34711 / CBS 6284 / DSM 70876 / NBRC 10599 / NRRL Y-10934 / UCD 77-7) TaxID=1071380 RepID=I2H612_HENB6|nr:hypothetical protein TBLA_0F02750 [Tetrapisispora blattae CBS 6284]CCH61814.1 hypothetical protein TBLA_0F02750 [Tetrapisispora blattae CBS 6284]
MNSLTLQTPLTASEQQLYAQKFRQLDPESLGIVTGESVRPLLASTGLSSNMLSKVWSLADVNNNGFLNFSEFSAALRMISHLQQLPTLNITKDLYAKPSQSLVNFNGVVRPPPASNQPAQGLSPSNTPSNEIPLLNSNDVSKFSQLFDRSTNGAQTLSGDKAKDIFTKANLSNHLLGEIWALCDRNASGSLTKVEFIMAMYLIQLGIAHHPSLNHLPNSLPIKLWQSINLTTPAPVNVAKPNPPIQRQSTLSRVSSGAFSNASSDWSLSLDKKKQFDTIFDTLDKSHQGQLGSSVLVPFFLSSKLNQETLASIWDLADIHNNAEFTKVEFAIAMFLIQKKNAGIQLPDVIPDQLLKSPTLGLFNPPQGATTAPPQPPATTTTTTTTYSPSPSIPQPQMQIPSRDTKPAFQTQSPQHTSQGSIRQQQQQQTLAQHTTSGSLNELLVLNDTFTTQTGNPAQIQPSYNLPNTLPAMSPVNTSGSLTNQMNKRVSTVPQPTITEEPRSLSNTNPPTNTHYHTSSVSISPLPQTVQRSLSTQQSPSMINSKLTHPTSTNSFQNRDIFADSDASAKLSTATTELTNLSNQMSSLTNQASINNEKKSKTEMELKRVTDMKNSMQLKLTTLRQTNDKTIKDIENTQLSINTINNENTNLQTQLVTLENTNKESELKLNELTAQFNESQKLNDELKEKMTTINTTTNDLENKIEELKSVYQKEKSMTDVNSKQLELKEINVETLNTELSDLQEKIDIYLKKQKELDDYKTQVEQQHAQLESTYQQLATKTNELNERQNELDLQNKNIVEQENVYKQNVERLDSMFDELKKRKESFDQSNAELHQQHIDYAQRVQDLSEKKMQLSMGELPPNAKEIIDQYKPDMTSTTTNLTSELNSLDINASPANPTNDSTLNKSLNSNIDNINEKSREIQHPTSQVMNNFDQSVGNVSLPQSETNSTHHDNSAIPGNWSSTEDDRAVMQSNESQQTTIESNSKSGLENIDEHAAINIQNPRTQSTATEDTSDDEPFEDTSEDLAGMKQRHSYMNTADYSLNDNSPHPSSIEQNQQHSSTGPSTGTPLPSIPQNAPIATDFTGTSSQISQSTSQPPLPPQQQFSNTASPSISQPPSMNGSYAPITPISPVVTAPLTTKKDAFDDEFSGLEQANVEDDFNNQDSNLPNMTTNSFDETNTNLDAEFQNNGFTGSYQQSPIGQAPTAQNISPMPQGFVTLPDGSIKTPDGQVLMPLKQTVGPQIPQPQLQSSETRNVSNDEWNEIFSGFGNSTNGQTPNAPGGPVPQGMQNSPTATTTSNSHSQSSLPQQPVPIMTQQAPTISQQIPNMPQQAPSMPQPAPAMSQQAPIMTQPTPIPSVSQTNTGSPISRSFSTTPKSLAIEELSGMGFTQEEARKALEQCNWDLDAATNFLLDSA